MLLLILERLLLVAAWTAIAYAIAAYAAHVARRPWLYIPAFLVLFIAPVWDVVPGLIALSAANAAVGGSHIYRPGNAVGFLDRRVHTAIAGWTELSLSSFDYIEIRSDEQPFTGQPDSGYYELRLSRRGSADCRRFEAMPGEASVSAALGRSDYCPTYVKRAAPISRYVVDSSEGWQPLEWLWWSRPVEAKWTRVRDQSLGVDLCSNYIFRYRPWLADIGFDLLVPDWPPNRDPDEEPTVDLAFILQPAPR